MRRIAAIAAVLALSFLSAESASAGLSVEIDGKTYTSDATLSPRYPLVAVFRHTDPAVQFVRMRHPSYGRLAHVYPVGQPARLAPHDVLMLNGVFSASVFIAVDADGRYLDRLTLRFKLPFSGGL